MNVQTPPTQPNPHSRRILTAREVSELFFKGDRSDRWIRQHIPSSIEVGRERRWIECDVWAFLCGEEGSDS